MRDEMDQRAVIAEYHAGRSAGEDCGVSGDRVESQLQVGRRRGDDAEDFRRGSLLLQSHARLGQEPRVLHSNDGLRREILQERDLLVGEETNFLPVQHQRAEQSIVSA